MLFGCKAVKVHGYLEYMHCYVTLLFKIELSAVVFYSLFVDLQRKVSNTWLSFVYVTKETRLYP